MTQNLLLVFLLLAACLRAGGGDADPAWSCSKGVDLRIDRLNLLPVVPWKTVESYVKLSPAPNLPSGARVDAKVAVDVAINRHGTVSCARIAPNSTPHPLLVEPALEAAMSYTFDENVIADDSDLAIGRISIPFKTAAVQLKP